MFALYLLAVSRASSDKATHIIRFEDEKGNVQYGQYLGDNKAQVLADDVFTSSRLGQDIVQIKKLLAPIPMPNTIVGIGLNYWGHINASHLTPPENPSIFFKNRYSYNVPFGPIEIPEQSTRPDYEGELGIVLSKRIKDVSEDDALDYVLGYTVCHDVSARCLQNTENGKCPGNGGQWSFSKGFDSHGPLGPALATKEGVPNADGSGLWLETRVNGELRQNQTTSTLIFGTKKIVSWMSIGTTYDAGTVICTGTPDGVGDTMDPQVYLQDGDVVSISIDNIGVLQNPVAIGGKTAQSVYPESLDDFLESHNYVHVE